MIDEYSVVSNGILAKTFPNFKTVIVDPLGYYTIYVKEEIEPIPPFPRPPFRPTTGGGGVLFDIEGFRQQFRKRITLRIEFANGETFYKEVFVDNIKLEVVDVSIEDQKIYLKLKSITEHQEMDSRIEVKVIDLKIN
jgi:hypothetical protein